MSFWGVEVKPGKPYTFSSEDAGGKLFVTQATLGLGSSMQKSVLQCNVGDKSPVLLCSLLPNKNECCPLNLGAFDENADVKFSVIGPTSIHIAGFVEDQAQEDGSESDSYGEDIAETETDGSSDYESDDYEDDFIDDDDMEMFGNPATRKSGVVIEEIEDEEIPATEKSVPKTKKKKNLDNDKISRQQVVEKGNTKALLESEDEDGFPVSAKENSSKKSSEGKKKNKVELQAKDDNDHVKNLKRKVNSDVDDLEHQRGFPENDSLPAGIIVEENVKQKKKKKKKKNQEAEGKTVASTSDAVADDRTESKENDSAVSDRAESDEKSENKNVQTFNGDISGEKKNKKKKKKNLVGKGVSNGGVTEELEMGKPDGSAEKKLSTAEDGTKKSKAKTSHVRNFSNGLVIEELEMGKPDGRRASAGNKVGVHYVGKLKNGKIFDSNIGRAPFKFRLGIGQVIKGWDVGVEGMRIGDKRRLTVPPSMAYGERGCPPQIPPNSWLVFEVTLVNVS